MPVSTRQNQKEKIAGTARNDPDDMGTLRTGEYIKKRPRAAGKAALGRFCGALQIIPHPEAFQKRQILTAGPDHRQEPV